jgi:hypothetical protein
LATGAKTLEGKRKSTRSTLKHGIYGSLIADDERPAADAIRARLGSVDEELVLLRLRVRRALAAEHAAYENDENGLEVVKHHDREASEYTAGDETVKERIDYNAHIERLTRRIESLEKTRSELLKADRENVDGRDDGPVTEIAVHVVTAENVHLYRKDGESDE